MLYRIATDMLTIDIIMAPPGPLLVGVCLTEQEGLVKIPGLDKFHPTKHCQHFAPSSSRRTSEGL